MHMLIVILHVLACLALILIVLLQTGRGAEMGAAFGGASQTLFGGSGGTTFMSKLTTVAAIIFMLTCLGLTYLSGGVKTKSIMENVPVETVPAPTLPEAKPVQSPPAQQMPAEKPAPQAGDPAKPEQKATPPAASQGQEKPQGNAPAAAPKQ